MVQIRPGQIYCDTYGITRCMAKIGENPFYYDGDHLLQAGVSLISEQILTALKSGLPPTEAEFPK